MNKLTKGGISVLAVGAIAAGAGAIWDLKNRIAADDDFDLEFDEATDEEES